MEDLYNSLWIEEKIDVIVYFVFRVVCKAFHVHIKYWAWALLYTYYIHIILYIRMRMEEREDKKKQYLCVSMAKKNSISIEYKK